MNQLVLGSLDTPQLRKERTAFFASVMVKGVDGSDGHKEIEVFLASYERVAHYLGDEFRKVLAGNESDLAKIAGRLKYVGASLKILKTCGEVAVTCDGLCREFARICMANLYGEIEGLKDTLEYTQMAATKAA